MQNKKFLNSKIDIDILPSIPFSFDGTFHKPSHFPTPDRLYEAGKYWQSLRFQDQHFGLKFFNLGTVENPRIGVSLYHEDKGATKLDIEALKKEIEYRYDLKSNMSEFTTRYAKDSILGPAIARWRGMRVCTPYSFYEFTVITTVLQNTVVRRSVQMIRNLFEKYGRLICFNGKELWAFWSPSAIDTVDESELRTLKVGYRAKTFKRQARYFVSNIVDVERYRRLDKESLRKKLLELYGVGPSTVQYILFELFHHYDACEHIPPWEQKIYSRLLFDKELVDIPIILEEINRRWKEWKMLALHYLFENLFWLRKHKNIPWLEKLIRL
jgi:3-methyladenine DNA glycosylase/8-oxoguanine DNA glycosylase